MANARKSFKADTGAPIDQAPQLRAPRVETAFPRAADMRHDVRGVSPARMQQAWLEGALQAERPSKFSYRTRIALIVGVSGSLWLGIAAAAAFLLG